MDYVVYEKGQKVIYIVCLRAIYGMLIAALEWYKKFRNNLEEIGFIFNYILLRILEWVNLFYFEG